MERWRRVSLSAVLYWGGAEEEGGRREGEGKGKGRVKGLGEDKSRGKKGGRWECNNRKLKRQEYMCSQSSAQEHTCICTCICTVLWGKRKLKESLLLVNYTAVCAVY